MSRTFSDFARHAFRAYRNGPITVGHSLLKRTLNFLLPQQQDICLRSGLKLRLDLSKGNQNGIFWEDGDAEEETDGIRGGRDGASPVRGLRSPRRSGRQHDGRHQHFRHGRGGCGGNVMAIRQWLIRVWRRAFRPTSD